MTKVDVIGKIVNHLPKHEFNGGWGEKVVKFFDKQISVPENRLLIGVSALASQPFIDLYNKDVDEKTRIVSCARTVAKTLSGTILGVAIRAGCIHLAKNYSELDNSGAKPIKKMFSPSNASVKNHAYRQYQNAIGTLLAVVGLLFSNFLLDAPLTAVLTNVLVKKMESNPKIKTKEALDETA